VASELLEERANLNFDQEELYCLFHSDPEVRADRIKVEKDQIDHPELANTHKYYEMTPAEIQTLWMKKLKKAWEVDRQFYFKKRPLPQYYWIFHHQGQPPIGLHTTMFA
jgi:hypothetical protein